MPTRDDAPEGELDPYEPDERLTREKVRRGAILMWGLVLVTLAGLIALAVYAFSPPAPARFYQVEMLTPSVHPTGEAVASSGAGVVRIRTLVDSPLDPSCLASTQFFVVFPNGHMWSVAGARYTTPGQTKRAVYQAPVPQNAPLGRASFFVRDTYNCGLRAQRVESPGMAFSIVGGLVSPAAETDPLQRVE